MDYTKAADEAARRVLEVVERDGCLHRSSIARVIEDELHRANRAPHMMMGAPLSAGEIDANLRRLHDAIIRKHDPG
jgi:hypothetical protein